MYTAEMNTDKMLNTISSTVRNIRMMMGPALAHSIPEPIHEPSPELLSTPGQARDRAMTVVNGKNSVVVVSVATDRRIFRITSLWGASVTNLHPVRRFRFTCECNRNLSLYNYA